MKDLKNDKQLYNSLVAEQTRQTNGLELIPSENYVSRAVLQALATEFTNKYSEGYPGKRYYGGQVNTDEIEQIAINRAKELFKADHANVQPYSGAIANLATFSAWLEPGDTILGMDLSHGGHLTHGHPTTLMYKLYNFITYKMKDIETGELDYSLIRELALKHRPKIILAGFSSYPRNINYKEIARIAEEVEAVSIVDIAHIAGLIAGKVLENPFDYGINVCTSTTHKTLRGPRGGLILSKGIVSNPLKKVDKLKENLPTLIDRSVFPGVQGGPIMNSILAKGVAFGEALQPEFTEYSSQILKNAKALADSLMNSGFKLITNGTDNHMILIDMVSSFGISGKDAEQTFERIGLTMNKNVIPDDTRPPYDPSGVRLGTPAVTTRGMKEDDMKVISEWMKRSIIKRNDDQGLIALKQEVTGYCKQYPIPSLS